jgi:hypothetical protein
MRPATAAGGSMANGKTVWAGRATSVLASLLFLFSAILKLKGGPDLEKGFAHLGLPMSIATALGVLEAACVVLYLVPASSILGAILLTGYVGGAICTHWRVGDPVWVQFVLGVFVWLGVYLQEPRLKNLIPLRRS